MTTTWTSRAITASEAAILHHPDRRTAWAPLVVVEVAGAPLTAADVHERIAALAARHSILRARLIGDAWVASAATPELVEFGGLAALCRPFDLTAEAPLRVALGAGGRRVAIAAHHAALDGRALLMVAEHVLAPPELAEHAPTTPATGATPASSPSLAASQRLAPSGTSDGSAARGAIDALLRLGRPADRVAPSVSPPAHEVFVTADLPAEASARVAQLAAAACAASRDWNAARGARWRRVGLTIPVGGPAVLGNVSTHRRIDVPAAADVSAAVQAALRATHAPAEGAPSPALMRLLGPVVDRFSDSLLVSNLGRVDLPGAAAVDFYPQARGRSAVAFGAATVAGGARRLTLRARDLTQADAQALLNATVAQL